MKKNLRLNKPTVLFITFTIVGIFIMTYPVISSHLNTGKNITIIEEYNKAITKLASSNYLDLFENAKNYNQNLSNKKLTQAFSKTEEEQNKEYLKLLNPKENGVMGYIKIPKIDVEIPIYHGTSNKVLQKGVGHFENSSLPVGGESTHSILSAHRGLPSSRLFTDLDQLEEGDMFYIYVLDKVLAYRVDQIKVVEPSNIENLKIVDNEDYITLVTCTPYAINTHRLLVRGTRVEYNEQVLKNIPIERKLSTPDIILIVGIILVAIIVISVIIIIRKVKEPKEEQREEKIEVLWKG